MEILFPEFSLREYKLEAGLGRPYLALTPHCLAPDLSVVFVKDDCYFNTREHFPSQFS